MIEDISNHEQENKLHVEVENNELDSKNEKIDFNESNDGLAQEVHNNVDQLKEEIAELKEKNLRLFADFENTKKRNLKERFEMINNASTATLTAILPVLDDFDRAKQIADKMESYDAFTEGVLLVYNKFNTILNGLGLKSFDSTNEIFDVNQHEAVTKIPAPNDTLKGKVVDTLEKGYMLNGKIIRYAKVVIGE